MPNAIRNSGRKVVLHTKLRVLRQFLSPTDSRIANVLADLALFYREREPAKAATFWAQALTIFDANGTHLPARTLGMHHVIHGVHQFQRDVFRQESELYHNLAHGQHPEVLFICCSDSRIETSHVTQLQPGELFVLRHVGNIVPRHGDTTSPGAAEASIEFAVTALAVKDIIICGHQGCGAIRGLLHPETLTHLPAVEAFLSHAHETRAKIAALPDHLTAEERLERAIEENVLTQIEHMKTHPSVAEALAAGKVNLHGWVYEIESGNVRYFDFTAGAWKNL